MKERKKETLIELNKNLINASLKIKPLPHKQRSA